MKLHLIRKKKRKFWSYTCQKIQDTCQMLCRHEKLVVFKLDGHCTYCFTPQNNYSVEGLASLFEYIQQLEGKQIV